MRLTLLNSTETNDILSWEVPYSNYKIKTIRFASTLDNPYLIASYNEDVRQIVLVNSMNEGDTEIVYNTTFFTVSFKIGFIPKPCSLSNITEVEIELVEV